LNRKTLAESSEQAVINDKLIMVSMGEHLGGPLKNHCISAFQLWYNIASKNIRKICHIQT